MTAPKQIVRLRDLSGGEMVAHAKRRDDEPSVRAACRTLRNVRILSSGAVEQRPGRTALFQAERTDEVRMSPDATYRLCFGEGTLRIRNSAGTSVALESTYDWTSETLDQIVWKEINNDVVITYPGQRPKIARWDGDVTWTFLDWRAYITEGNQKRVPFARISPKNVSMSVGGRTGTIPISFDDNVLFDGHVGTRMRFVNRQIEILSVLSGSSGTAVVMEPLPGSQILTFATAPNVVYTPGEVVTGSVTGARAYVSETSGSTITVQLITTASSLGTTGSFENSNIGSVAFTTADSVVGPGGGLTPSGVAALSDPVAVPLWDEEVFNEHQGWPQSVNVDQGRLIFCDFPAVPEGIGWSAALAPDDFYPGPDPTDAIFETAPRKARVYHVAAGADEFAMTDRGVYYIPISEANPLRPGSVAFRRIPGPSSSAVRPVETAQGTVYVNNGLNRVLAITGTGQTALPWVIRPVSDLHSHLFAGLRCLALEEGDGDPPDELVYAVNADGTVAVGRYQSGKEWVGWGLWDSVGEVTWVSALGANVLFSVDYAAGVLCERVDATQWLDAAAVYNAVPTPLAPAAGKSVYWYISGETADAMDGRRYLGERTILTSGAVDAQPGETFTDETFGLGFDITIEPFIPHVQGGQSLGQTMKPRNISAGAVAVQNSTGFRVEYYKPFEQTWTLAKDRAPYMGGENQEAEPPLREEAVGFTAPGSDHDPRIRVVKDFPGPLRVLEIGVEIGA